MMRLRASARVVSVVVGVAVLGLMTHASVPALADAGHPSRGAAAGATAGVSRAKRVRRSGGRAKGKSARANAKRRAKRRRASRRPAVSAAYRRMRARWHRRAPTHEVRAWQRRTPPPMVLHPVNGRGHYEVRRNLETGVFDDDASNNFMIALAHHKGDGSSRPIHPRLLEVLHRAVEHFNVPYVHVISGYRPDRASSRHTQGRAVDVVFPGVSDRRLAAYLRQQGFVGVGIYPVSGFVHLDVRARSYFWVDRSGPEEANRAHGILAELARRE
ncbi:MAG: DUF882 domain-containing protein, partial [Myxococcales bacterium]|nr:DUF882 domain-containing protein [Myxococcales bacterium]